MTPLEWIGLILLAWLSLLALVVGLRVRAVNRRKESPDA